MSLDPSVSPGPGVVAAVAVCLWMAAIGAPLAYAAFRDRPRLVWPCYAPIVGVVVVLLVTNLAAYVITGAAAAWVGLIGPSVAGAAIAWRAGVPERVSRQAAIPLLAMALVAAGVFALAYATRLHTASVDAAWHQALAFQLARGVFPPVTPYGVDASPVYHYGHNLLAASVMNAAGVFPWTAFDALRSFLVAVLVLAVVGFAYDVGAPLPLALGLGAAVGFLRHQLLLGIDTGLLEPSSPGHAFQWLDQSQWALALGFVVLVAAALHGGTGRRQAAVLAASAGVFALAEAAVMIFACAALALVGTARLLRLRGRERIVLAAALLVSAGLVVLAGGPISDVLLGRGVSTAGAYLAWEPVGRELQPVQPAGPWPVSVGIIPLTVIGAFAAYRRRTPGLRSQAPGPRTARPARVVANELAPRNLRRAAGAQRPRDGRLGPSLPGPRLFRRRGCGQLGVLRLASALVAEGRTPPHPRAHASVQRRRVSRRPGPAATFKCFRSGLPRGSTRTPCASCTATTWPTWASPIFTSPTNLRPAWLRPRVACSTTRTISCCSRTSAPPTACGIASSR